MKWELGIDMGFQGRQVVFALYSFSASTREALLRNNIYTGLKCHGWIVSATGTVRSLRVPSPMQGIKTVQAPCFRSDDQFALSWRQRRYCARECKYGETVPRSGARLLHIVSGDFRVCHRVCLQPHPV